MVIDDVDDKITPKIKITGPAVVSLDRGLPIPTHKHFKGGYYSLIGKAIDSSDLSKEFAVYWHIYPHEPKLWIRPWEEFHGLTETGIKRFEEISD